MEEKKKNGLIKIMQMKETKFTVLSVFAVLILLTTSSYAIFTSVQKGQKYTSLKIGSLVIDFNDTDTGMGNVINLNGAYPMSDANGQETTPYVFKIKNTGTISATYTIKLQDDTDMITEDKCQDLQLDKSRLKYSLDGKTPAILSDSEASSYTIVTGTLAGGKFITYSLRTWIDENSGNEVLGKHYHGKIVVDAVNSQSQYTYTNKNIEAAYVYDEKNEATKCITGEESTCVQTSITNADSNIAIGTIIKYYVNNNEKKYFYVLHDDGDALTLQQRENTIRNVAWYGNSTDNTKGPLTILPQLETATATWTNVNDQTYTMGTTVFKDNEFTGCIASGVTTSCTTNTYTLASRTSKARMITIQEAEATGCKVYQADGSVNGSCPDFIHNYLWKSSSLGGSINDDTQNEAGIYNYAYWTMSATSDLSTKAWDVGRYGVVNPDVTINTGVGARAVVVITK